MYNFVKKSVFLGGMCKKGTYCPIGSSIPIQCDPGYYCRDDNLSNVSGICSAGYYCNGSSIEERPVNKSYGDICPPGYYCETGSRAPKPCDAGYFAPGFANTEKSSCLLCKGIII